MKYCKSCNTVLEDSEFSKQSSSKDGLQHTCKKCMVEYRAKNKEKLLEKQKAYYEKNRQKILADKAKYHEENHEKILSKKKSKYAECPDAQLESNKRSYQKHREKILASKKEYAQKYPYKIAAVQAKRRASKSQATPLWANLKEIEAFYKAAKLLEMITGEKWQVDHVIPLQGKLVSGLHVETNLQLLKASDNRRKYNLYEI